MVRIPWGKFRGRLLSDIPASYLAWLVEESNAEMWLKRAATEELADRLGLRQSPARPQPCFRCKLIAHSLNSIYREAALQAHPDRGGSHEAMKGVNEIRDRLDAILRN
jgi:hypothetical protein